MSLDKYNEKRDFKKTAEPKGKVQRSKNKLIFVVQKHAASHLHYDFRIEIEGTLKSWAIPKGPSLDPDVKRLAILVEDHPYSYKDFEGTIPKGNYGAGNVIVWDNGTYIATENVDQKQNEKILIDSFNRGHLRLTLKGKKLKGDFSLVRLKGKEENAWLLIKKEDEFSTTKDILENDVSVISGITLEKQIKESKLSSNSINEPIQTDQITEINFVSPMLATPATKAFDNEDWIFEKKYDGYRIVTTKENKVELYSRNQQLYTKNFKTIADDLKKIKHHVILDGEVVVEDKKGQSNFQMLQNYIKTGKGELKYYVFDILNLDNTDLKTLKLTERKELLKILLKNSNLSRTFYSEHIFEKGIKLFEKSKKLKEEGIMAKNAKSTYQPGQRSADWIKIKNHHEEDTIIIGITKSKKERNYFGALLLGQYKNGVLQYIGKCGSGFSEDTLKELYTLFKLFITNESTIKEKISVKEEIIWIKPHFICTVKFTQWTNDRRLRHPVFIGIRKDKKLKEIIREEYFNNESTIDHSSKTGDDNLQVQIGEQILNLTNLKKIYFPQNSITKGELIHYYSEVSELILPYLQNRPQSLNRFPNGINGSSFYQKDLDTQKVPSWLLTHKIFSESNNKEIDYLICNDKETLIYMINLGCIDINPWNSTIQDLDFPDWIVIDIDPDTLNFEEVVTTALTIRKVLDNLEVDSYCKTSGASGMHVYIPLGAKYNYETVKLFAQIIAREVQGLLPDTTTLERSIKNRNHKIYIDYLQNRKGQTIAAPYSVRPTKDATVSTPLEWSEVNTKLKPTDFTIKNALQRFEKKGDIWKPVLDPGVDISKVLEKYNS